ncbi:C-type natriuretic peptide [Erpetoichthys calabaricus]|uniref:C-type natriuretic peptide n=1 Tax=Erpetoichthys calabaricus TaxID=27687 RepID=UPI0022340621|nr:C-type natriuretic peptide [Erpetoichthys calabaricus]
MMNMFSPSSSLIIIVLPMFAVFIQGRPAAHRRQHETLIDLFGKELGGLLADMEVVEGSSGEDASLPLRHSSFLPRKRGMRDAMDTEAVTGNRAWLRLFKDFMSSQKMFRGRTKKTQGRGCFGMKLDRISSMSGLGC